MGFKIDLTFTGIVVASFGKVIYEGACAVPKQLGGNVHLERNWAIKIPNR